MTQLLALPITIQLGLGIGYLCYLMAYGGDRRGHTTTDTLFLSFAFGIPAWLPLATGVGNLALNVVIGTVIAMLIAIAWRGKLRGLWHTHKHKIGLGRDDGRQNTWDALLNRPDLTATQVSVHTADGRILYLNDRGRYTDAPWEGLLLGTDGSILMVVEEEELPDGTEEQRDGISLPEHGTRMTYIPASEIRRVNIRV